ncbi:MAG: shikimate dehydrogenase [Anaerolineales bacterium]|nr:shikimate dehydrogenase [Anaerolineales bacterium]
MSARPFRLGLIGYPLGRSLSPQIHRAALASLGLEGDYRPYPLPPLPQGEARLLELLAALRGGELHGLNVTIPYKSAVLGYLDRLSAVARAIGAVNTILVQEGELLGENTDAGAFWADLQRLWGERLEGDRPALVLGAGGAARAVAYALLIEGWQVVVAARRREQAERLAYELNQSVHPLPEKGGRGACAARMPLRPGGSASLQEARLWEAWADSLQPSLVVNATPLGMPPQAQASPWPRGAALPHRAMIYDLVYNPPHTRWLRRAEAAGLEAANGLGMLIEQAAGAFQLWTGLQPPREALWRALA